MFDSLNYPFEYSSWRKEVEFVAMAINWSELNKKNKQSCLTDKFDVIETQISLRINL